MVGARKLRKIGTKRLRRKEHGADQRNRAQEEAARVQAREVRATEQKEGLGTLQKFQTVVDVYKLLKASAQFSPSTNRRQRLID